MLKPGVSPILRCPRTGRPLREEGDTLIAEGGRRYPIVRGVPRFVSSERYARSFGVEWNRYPRTQLDRANGTRISRVRFERVTGLAPEALAGRRVLEAGCGMGRFLDVLAGAGAEVWGADLSLAVEPAEENTRDRPRCQVVQADLHELPFGADFDFVYSIGVLHHTPDPEAAFGAIARHLAPGGRICVWVYALGTRSRLRARWIPRPHQVYTRLASLVPEGRRHEVFTRYARLALAARDRLPLGILWDALLPVQDLRRKRALQDGWEPDGDPAAREDLRFEWAMHGVYDAFTPVYARQHTPEEVLGWARRAGLTDVRAGEVPATVIARRAR
jgi:SAM-dependent methyltransferase